MGFSFLKNIKVTGYKGPETGKKNHDDSLHIRFIATSNGAQDTYGTPYNEGNTQI